MSKRSTPQKGTPKKVERKQEASGTHEQFSVAQFTDRVIFLDADDIRIDRDLTRGQVRTISESNVADLETAYSVNEPDELQLTVSQDRGMSTIPCPGSPLAPLAWLVPLFVCHGKVGTSVSMLFLCIVASANATQPMVVQGDGFSS